jgi:hypothetical protein
MASEPVSIMEGWLTGHVVVDDRIRLTVRVKDDELVLGIYTSAPIIRIQSQYAQGHRLIYQILKVPPSRAGDVFSEFA